MGNTPGKETRPTGSSSSSGSSGGMSTSAFAREYLNNFESHHTISSHSHHHGHGHRGQELDAAQLKRKREKEMEKAKYRSKQIMNLVVNYEENVDGGYLAPYGNYKYNLDYMTSVVRDLIIKRKLSPFFTPLPDFDENWTDEELLAFLKKNLKIHEDIRDDYLDDDYEDPNEHKLHPTANSMKRKESKLFKHKLKEKALEYQKHEVKRFEKDFKSHESNPAKYPNIPSNDLLLRVYRDCEECPICFLFYPKLLNTTRCCAQPICTECFVQMKRLDPHFPHDENNGNNNNEENTNSEDLISELVKCPFCAVDNFGITYMPPSDFKTGIEGNCTPCDFKFIDNTIKEEEDDDVKVGGNDDTLELQSKLSVVSSLTELDLADPFSTKKVRVEQKKNEREKLDNERKLKLSHKRNTSNTQSISQIPPAGPRKRRESLPPDAPSVVTIDTIRPDWEQKLLAARTKLARRSAAATALHATSLLDNDAHGNGSGRRIRSSNRQEHLEEMLIEEAMRLSLLDEEERKMREYMKNSM